MRPLRRSSFPRLQNPLALLLAAASLPLAACRDSSLPAHAAPLRASAVFGEVGLSPGQFAFPRAIDADGSTLWVIDKMGRVQQIDPSTGASLSLWRMPETALGKPTGLTCFPGNPPLLFVPDTHYQRILVYRIEDAGILPHASNSPNHSIERPTPAPIASFGRLGRGPGEFIYPTDIAVLPTPDGSKPARVYVSEYGENDRISIFEPAPDGSFQFRFSFGRWGRADDPDHIEFNRPQSIALDLPRQELLVADACNHRIGRFSLDGKLIRWIGSPDSAGNAPGAFSYPYGILPRGDGTAIVAELGNARIQHIDLLSGQSLGVAGTHGADDGMLSQPWGVAAIDNTLYVLDSGNNRIHALPAPSSLARSGGPP
jgi:hypothetical protein